MERQAQKDQTTQGSTLVMSLTPTHAKMLEVLSDGLPHHRDELHKCCGPSSVGVVKFHLAQIRKHLRPLGEDVVCVQNGVGFFYQHVRLLASPYKG